MIVKRGTTSLRKVLRALGKRGRVRALLAAAAVAVLVGGGTLWGLYYGMYLSKVRVAASLADLVDDAVRTRLAIVPNFLGGLFASDAERLVLDIKHVDFQRLAHKRSVALERGLLLASGEDFVPAGIRVGGESVRAKVRLKGDWVDHIAGSKWSFRVKMRGDDTLFGMKVFSLHHPRARRFIHEWIYHRALARESVLPLRYRFVELTVNGRDLGVYALEEHFDKRLVEHNGHRQGPILRFNEDLHWLDILATDRKGDASPTGLNAMRASYVDGFRISSLRRNEGQWRQYGVARSLLEAFRTGELSTSRVFDPEKLATFLALTDLMGAEHGGTWHNLRFYYNPITSRLEPVGFDANAGAPLVHLYGGHQGADASDLSFRAMAFADPAFTARYVAALERVSEPSYLDALFAEIGDEIGRNLRILHKEFPYFHYDERVFYENQKVIRAALRPAKAVHAYYDGAAPGAIRVEVGNIQGLPVEVLHVVHAAANELTPREPLLVPPTPADRPVAHQSAEFALPAGLVWSEEMAQELEIEYRLLGTSEIRKDAVFPWPRRIAGLGGGDLQRLPPNAESFPFVAVDEDARTVAVRPGSWTVDRDLILPAGYRVLAGPGTRLDLVNGALVLSYSPLELLGSEDAPIVFESSDATGQGLLVQSAGARSTLAHVRFRGLRSPDRGGWALTGAVTFYESPVDISDGEFAANDSEDGLNIVRSEFTIDRALFADTRSDAFDADFSDGEITRTAFVDAGNDAIDVSGSRVTVRQVRILRAGDKGLSAGEQAELTIEDVVVQGAVIAVASKDRSRVSIDQLRAEGAEIGLAVFQKKSEFGPASMVVKRAVLSEIPTSYLVEEGSTLTVEGRRIAAAGSRLKERLYEEKHG